MITNAQLDRIEKMLIKLDCFCRTELMLRPRTSVKFTTIVGDLKAAEALDKIIEADQKELLTTRKIYEG